MAIRQPTASTLGVDLASADENVAAAGIVWGGGHASLTLHRFPKRKAGGPGADADLVTLARAADAVGIDAPFGWPSAFLDLVRDGTSAPWSDAVRDALRFRATDHHVKRVGGFWPLSVSSDLVALPAMRCQWMLAELGVRDRSGADGAWEVYPRLGLERWELAEPATGYKGKEGARRRSALVDRLKARCPWLGLGGHEAALRESDDALDAVIASLLARAASLGLTEPIPKEHRALGRAEGWIVVPLVDSLDRLVGR